MADLKIRLQIAETEIFYYPDIAVICDPHDRERFFAQSPRVLVEVLSPDTERIDRREKFLSYTRIDALEEYVLLAQDKIEATVFRRSAMWQPEVMRQKQEQLHLPSISFSIPLLVVYEGVPV